MFRYFGLLLIALCIFFAKYQRHVGMQQIVQEFVSGLAEEERFLLDYFFRCLIQEDSIGYVLLGSKPMGSYGYRQPKVQHDPHLFTPVDQLNHFFDSFDEHNALIERGWQVWQKYASRFSGENIVFDTIVENYELNFKKIIVIDKQLMQSVVAAHFQKFAPLAPVKNSQAFCHSLSLDRSLKKKVYSRPDLLGICLGYGAKNAALFHKILLLYKNLGYFGFTLSKPSIQHAQQLEGELDALESHFKICSVKQISKKHLFSFGISFRADLADVETKQLQKKYSHYYRVLPKQYRSVNFLEKTLELIYLANESRQSLGFLR
jgi:hypothetical protein